MKKQKDIYLTSPTEKDRAKLEAMNPLKVYLEDGTVDYHKIVECMELAEKGRPVELVFSAMPSEGPKKLS
jgi:hypothetical protein